MWALAAYDASQPDAQDESVPELNYPYTIQLLGTASRMSKETVVRDAVTSDELSLKLAERGPPSTSSCHRMEYRMPDVPHLLSMEVVSRAARLPAEKAASATRVMANELRELRKTFGVGEAPKSKNLPPEVSLMIQSVKWHCRIMGCDHIF